MNYCALKTLAHLVPRFVGAAIYMIGLVLGYSTQAFAREPILERAFVTDASGAWTIEQAQLQALTPFEELLTGGYGTGAIWVRLRIDPRLTGVAANDSLFLRVRPMYLDHIQLFDQAEGFKPRAPIGDRQPISAQDEPAPFFLLKLKAGHEPRELWLRLESTSTRMAYFEVLDESTLRNSNLKIQSLASVYLTTVALFLVIGLLQAGSQRNGLTLAFVFYQIVTLINGVLSFGYARWLADGWIAPVVLDRLFSLNAIGFLFGLLFFSYAVTREISHIRSRTYVFFGLCLLPFILTIVQFIGLIRLSLAINALSCLILPTAFFIDAIFQARKKIGVSVKAGIPRSVVITYFGVSAAFACFAVLPIMGWSSAVEFNLYAVHLYAFSSGVLMLWLLQHRARVITKQRDTFLIEARQANARAELERTQRVERQQLLNMLGHELKTPMSTLKMLLGDQSIPKELAKRLSGPLTEMKEVVERTVQSGQLEDGEINLRWQQCDVVALIQDQLETMPGGDRGRLRVESGLQGAATIQTDPYFLGVIVRNLIDNALKYSPDDSTIQLTLRFAMHTNSWSLTVGNEVGRAGRPDPEKIFVRYWRSPHASYRSGSGQGLYIVHRLAGLLQGSLILEPNTGSVVFRLVMAVHPQFAKEIPS